MTNLRPKYSTLQFTLHNDDFLGSNDKDQGLGFKQSSKHKKAFMRLRRIDPDGPLRLDPVP